MTPCSTPFPTVLAVFCQFKGSRTVTGNDYETFIVYYVTNRFILPHARGGGALWLWGALGHWRWRCPVVCAESRESRLGLPCVRWRGPAPSIAMRCAMSHVGMWAMTHVDCMGPCGFAGHRTPPPACRAGPGAARCARAAFPAERNPEPRRCRKLRTCARAAVRKPNKEKNSRYLELGP